MGGRQKIARAEGRIRLGISACLLGEKLRYDGGHKLYPFLKDTLGAYVDWVAVCPEVEFGLPVSREPMHLFGKPDSTRLVTVETRLDRTDALRAWARKRVKEFEKQGLCGFVFKSKSPSCGLRGVKVCGKSGRILRKGTGLFAQAFVERFPRVPVEDEERLADPVHLASFIGRVIVRYLTENSLGGSFSKVKRRNTRK